jgi:hypothetical protein
MGRTKNQKQKLATVHLLKNGKWAVFVTLVAPRELEGKMRSGRQKFERQTEALANGLCAEINAILFDKKLARQLSDREQEIAKKLFWEILEPGHPEWMDHLVDIIHHAEKTGYRPSDGTVPTVTQAAQIFYKERMVNLERETRIAYRHIIAYLLPKFGHLNAYEMTDQQILQLAYGSDPLKYMKSSVTRYDTATEAESHLWDTLEDSKGKRPWSSPMIHRFLTGVRAFKNWMHESKDPVTQMKRNWCPKSTIETPEELKNGRKAKKETAPDSDLECVRNPALTIPQVQALIDVAWVAYEGKYAPFYVHGFWCGSRAKEISRTNVTAFNSHDGVLAVSENAAKTDQARESEVYPNTITMVEALRFAGLYTTEGLQPDLHERAAIHHLAGFISKNWRVVAQANCERKRLEARGILLPTYSWGMQYPQNAMRRTALSMHYKLFLNVALTTGWGGNSPGVFKEFYKRLVTKADAREYWVMLPTWLKEKADIRVELPKNHKLDSAITEDVKTAVSAACEAMGALKREVSTATEAHRLAAKLRKRKARKSKSRSEDLRAASVQIETQRAPGIIVSEPPVAELPLEVQPQSQRAVA